MLLLLRAAVAVALLGIAAYGQTPAPELERTFTFRSATSEPQAQSLANLIRTLGDIRQVSADTALHVRGTSAQIAMAEQLFADFDNPAPQGLVIRSFAFPGGADDVVRIFHIPNLSAQQLQEVLNLGRTLADVQRAMAYPVTGIAVRGTGAKADLFEWLVRAVIDPTAQTSSPAVYEYRLAQANLPARGLDAAHSAVRVFYIKHAGSAQAVQEIVNLIRTIADTQRMMVYFEGKAIALRATPAQAALAEWLVSELDKPAAPAGDSTPHEYTISGLWDGVRVIDPPEIVRVIHPPAQNAQELQTIVNRIRAAGIQRTFPCNAQGAIVLRGTFSQVNLAVLSTR